MNCLENIVRYILYIFNILFLIAGILLIVLGSLMLSDMGQFKTFQQAVDTETIPIIIIVLGCVIFIISFFGCFGAIRESICSLSIYAIFMFILLCLQIALIVWVFVRHTDFVSTMQTVVQTAWNENTEDQHYPMDALQLAFDCCGLTGYQDYAAINLNVPSSCCGDVDTSSACSFLTYMSKPGCQTQFYNFWTNTLYIIREGGIGVAIVEFIALLFTIWIMSGMRRSKGEVIEVQITT